MNIKALRIFRAIVAEGSLAAAAEVVYLSQSAASRLVSDLEGELRITLFNRDHRRLTLTREGEALYRETEHILRGIDEIPHIAEEIRTTAYEPFRLVTAPRIGQGFVAEALALMIRETPNLRCEVDIQSRFDLETKVGTRRYDLGIVSLPVSHSLVDIENHPLIRVRAEALVPLGHPLADRKQLSATDLAHEPLLGLWRDQLWRQQIDDFFRSGGVTGIYTVETKSTLMACQMVRHGAGVTVLDRLCAHAIDLTDVRLIPIEPARWIAYGYIHRRGQQLSANALKFLDCLKRTAIRFIDKSAENAASTKIAWSEKPPRKRS